jgi:hypothetical protein
MRLAFLFRPNCGLGSPIMLSSAVLAAAVVAFGWAMPSYGGPSHEVSSPDPAARIDLAPFTPIDSAEPSTDAHYADDAGYMVGRYVLPALVFLGVCVQLLFILELPQELLRRMRLAFHWRKSWDSA